ncbi:MAG: ABC transporter ATP-binding protein [Chloroflexota bacterium]|nr:ABC transporter ATP-binding protein [Chloroflexota bacterium]
MIRLRRISKFYRLGNQQVAALRGVDLEISDGEFMAIMGPSGSGKSTLMNIIGCLDRPSEGVYELDGLNVSRLGDAQLATMRNRRLGFVFQSFNLLPRLNAVDQVAMPLSYRGVGNRKKLARAALRMVGLGSRLNHRPTQLSGGQQQRVAIARAIVGNPTIILADEPTGALDTKTSHDVMEIFRKLNEERGITIAFVTHEHDVAAYTRRIVSLRDGQIISDEPNIPIYNQAPAPEGPPDATRGTADGGLEHAEQRIMEATE